MSQIVHRINETIISGVVNRHHQWFQHYYELKAAIAALMAGEREYDISCRTLHGVGKLERYHGVCRVFPFVPYRGGRKYPDKPTLKTAPSYYPLLMEWGFVLDGKIVSPKEFISAYETGMSAKGRGLSSGYRVVKEYAFMTEWPNYLAITDHLGVNPVIRITFNKNYEG